MDFKNKKVAVIGAGVEGVSSTQFFKKQGANVTILDKKNGKDYLKNLDQYDIIVRSPGVKLSVLHQVLPKESYSKITSNIKLFFEECPAKIIGVTGTKGKGTTATLIYEMLKKDGRDAYIGGNIGGPPLDFLEKLTKDSWVVLELSSFQLQDLTKSPYIAVLLMITSEHLDYHKDTNEYVEAKRNIVHYQTASDAAIINRDYPASNESDVHTHARVFQVSRERESGQGCYVKDRAVWVKQNGIEKKIIDIKDIFLPGEHNLENVCAAVMAATLAGVSKNAIVGVLREFRGLEHRLELVGEVRGVWYYDDSFSTTPETAIAAILAFKQPEILILGGSSKGSDFSQLGEYIRQSPNIKAIIGIGIEWPRIKERIRNQESGIMVVEGARDMQQIVQAAAKIAEPGDVVLLSPACASFGMFKNYKDRGEQFKKEVRKLL